MTLRDALQEGIRKLESSGIEEAALDAWYLLEYVTGMSRASYLADAGREMEAEQKERYAAVIARRSERIPLQHITGVQEFMGLEFQVNEHVLIPRQDTEVLVETALKILVQRFVSPGEQEQGDRAGAKQEPGENVRLLDMCTGSGCILLSLLYYARQEARGKRIQMEGLGVDISDEALKVAKENAKRLGIEAEFAESDLFSEIDGMFDMIVSNPPYIPTAVIDTLQPEVREHDPRLALDGKEDGLHFYRRIVEEGRSRLKRGGVLLFEIGSDQGEQVAELMKQAGYRKVETEKDLAGLDRVVFGVYDTCER